MSWFSGGFAIKAGCDPRLVAWRVVLLSTVVLCVLACGCRRRVQPVVPEVAQVVTNRMQDAAYVRSLRENSTRQMSGARARELVAARQKVCAERVKASLAEGADDAALKAALQKDAEWAALEVEAKQAADALLKAQEDAKRLIRARMEEEAQAIKDVRSGKARVAAPVRTE